MKKFRCLFSFFLVCLLLSNLALAYPTIDNQPSEVRIDFADGSYVIEQILEFPSSARSTIKSGQKSAVYYSSNDIAMFTVTVIATFSYDRTSAEATSAACSVTLNHPDTEFVSKRSGTNGATAFGIGSVRCNGIIKTIEASLTCSPTGVLS